VNDDRLDKLDYYTLLGIEPGCDAEAIKRAFRTFARRYHPDRFAGDTPDKVQRASQIYRRGSEAYQVLLEETTRKAYDEALQNGILRLSGDARERVAAQEKRRSDSSERIEAVKQHPIQSLQARAYFQRAVEASHAGDWRQAWKLIRAAMDLEPGSEFLKARLAMVERRLR
jgi:curved DNA-binding protein CbpA